jgi:hypothetical protein
MSTCPVTGPAVQRDLHLGLVAGASGAFLEISKLLPWSDAFWLS